MYQYEDALDGITDGLFLLVLFICYFNAMDMVVKV